MQDLTSVPVISGPDLVIDMKAHVVGLALDRSGRHLFVNIRYFCCCLLLMAHIVKSQPNLTQLMCRRWPEGAVPSPNLPPPIASEIEMRVLDLKTMR